MIVATIHERLNELFDEDQRNDTAIAAELGVSKQSVSAWRNGTRSPKKKMLLRISEMFDVCIEWLMGYDVEKDGMKQQTAIVIPNSEFFVKVMKYMSQEDYETVIDAFNRTEKKMRELGVL